MGTHYAICGQDRIVEVSPDWDELARSNGGEDAQETGVLGHPVWSFVAGVECESYLNALFFAVRRSRRPLTVPYRCDSRTMRRWYDLTIAPLEARGLRVSHNLVREEPRQSVRELPDTPHLRQCSQCLRCRTGSEWMEAWVIDPRPDFTERQVVCPDCRKVALTAISALSRPTSAPSREPARAL